MFMAGRATLAYTMRGIVYLSVSHIAFAHARISTESLNIRNQS